MKLDKDALLKQKFWILLGAFALFWVVGLSILLFLSGDPITKALADYTSAKGAVEKYPHPKNDTFLPPWNDYGEKFKAHKNEVWKIAWYGDKDQTVAPGGRPWKGQGLMYTWISSPEHPLNDRLLYPTSPFSTDDREWFKGNKDSPVYRRQFDLVYFELKSEPKANPSPKDPPGFRPLDPVTFKGDYYSVMKPVDFESGSKAPDPEECWLAQEDFWVKREVLYVVRDALTTSARMDNVDAEFEKTPPADPKPLAWHVFRNDSWEVHLLFDQDDQGNLRVSPRSTIKNVHVSHRDQDLGTTRTPSGAWFLLRQGNASWPIPFEGERVAWQQERTLGAVEHKDGIRVDADLKSGDLRLEQVFDVSNTPVTEIDELAVPKVSQRNANRPLVPTKPERYGKKEAAPPAPGAPPTTGTGTTGTGTTGMTPPNGTTGFGSMQGPPGQNMPGQQQGPPADLTANYKIDRDRYIFVTDQSRHLPLAVTLTMDQSHLHEVLGAFANSRLRFQTTQVEFRRVPSAGPASTQPGTVPGAPGFPPSSSTFPPSGSTPRPPMSPGSPGSPTVPPPSSTSGTPMGTPNFNPQTGAAQAPTDQENPNLVEVTIYGVASLYERPPQ